VPILALFTGVLFFRAFCRTLWKRYFLLLSLFGSTVFFFFFSFDFFVFFEFVYCFPYN